MDHWPSRRNLIGRDQDRARPLTPEEESLPDADDDYDDTLPADLWFRRPPRQIRSDRVTV